MRAGSDIRGGVINQGRSQTSEAESDIEADIGVGVRHQGWSQTSRVESDMEDRTDIRGGVRH